MHRRHFSGLRNDGYTVSSWRFLHWSEYRCVDTSFPARREHRTLVVADVYPLPAWLEQVPLGLWLAVAASAIFVAKQLCRIVLFFTAVSRPSIDPARAKMRIAGIVHPLDNQWPPRVDNQ